MNFAELLFKDEYDKSLEIKKVKLTHKPAPKQLNRCKQDFAIRDLK